MDGRPRVDLEKLQEARRLQVAKPKRPNWLAGLLSALGFSLLVVLGFSMVGCGAGFAEVKFVEAHGCGGFTGAVVMDDGSTHAITTGVCGYALETPNGVVGCAVVERVNIDGIELGSGAVPPSAPECYQDGSLGPFRLGRLSTTPLPVGATRQPSGEPDAHSQTGGGGSGPLPAEHTDSGAE